MKLLVTKFMSTISMLIFLSSFLTPLTVYCQKKYTASYIFPGKDSLYPVQRLDLTMHFESREAAGLYVSKLPQTLLSKGFPAASVDSVFYDSTHVRIKIYLGEKYKWAQILTDSVDPVVLEQAGWKENQYKNKAINFSRLRLEQEKIIEYYEDNGYPFASVSLKNIGIKDDLINAQLSVIKGPLYHIDSIRIYGKVKIKNLFLQHYLGIANGSVYNNASLQKVSTLIRQLPFLQEEQAWDVSMLGTGATLNLYLAPKPSSQVNVLVGFVPASTLSGKAQITADVHLDLKNSLGSGESLLLNWQQLQPESPRLDLGYTQPYIFNSNFGVDVSFDLLKKDSSYLHLSAMAGLRYRISASETFKLFFEDQQDFLLSVDSNAVIDSKKLPANMDVSSRNIGIGYHFTNLNYVLNPRKGNEMDLTATGGIKKTGRNNEIVHLKDPADPGFDFNSLYDSVKSGTYRFQIIAAGAHYFPLGKISTVKTAISLGFLGSPQIFRNELFRIGGYQLLRGFDEESIYANKYAVFTAEYRYLVGTNSYFFGFSDAGFTRTKFGTTDYSNRFLSGGLGLEFETKFGLLNISYAVGKRNDVPFDLKNSSKIHFGYINYF